MVSTTTKSKAFSRLYALSLSLLSGFYLREVFRLQVLEVNSFKHIADMASFTHDVFVVVPERIVILSIGSESRTDYQRAQEETFGTEVPVLFYTEKNSPPCVICKRWPQDEGGRGSELMYTAFLPGWRRPFYEKDHGWWCAQKRPLAAVKSFLMSRTYQQLPDFLMVIDDDTFVNHLTLKTFLRPLNASEPRIFVNNHLFEKEEHRFLGGAGWIISRPVLMALLAPFVTRSSYELQDKGLTKSIESNNSVIDECIDRQNGGSWCYEHSDWVTGYCLYIAVDLPWISADNVLRQDSCEVPDQRITCHYAPPEQQYAFYKKLKRTPPESGTEQISD
jgi:hypothetical protein